MANFVAPLSFITNTSSLLVSLKCLWQQEDALAGARADIHPA